MDSAKITVVHETRAGKVSDMLGEAKVLVRNTDVADRRIGRECVGGYMLREIQGFGIFSI